MRRVYSEWLQGDVPSNVEFGVQCSILYQPNRFGKLTPQASFPDIVDTVSIVYMVHLVYNVNKANIRRSLHHLIYHDLNGEVIIVLDYPVIPVICKLKAIYCFWAVGVEEH